MDAIKTKAELEKMLDRASVSELLTMLSEICAEKAEHIRGHWQDETLAKSWDKLARLVDTASSQARKTTIG